MFQTLIKSVTAIALIWLSFAGTIALAFTPLPSNTNPEILTRYSAIQADFTNKYSELRTRISPITERAIVRSERAVTRAYQLLNSATSERAKSIAERTLARSIKALDTRYTRAQRTLLTALGSPAPAPTSTALIAPTIEVPKWTESTDANFLYYADQFEDGRTANGDTFKHAGFSGARCNIALGTLTQIRFGEISTTIKINDRPNCAKHADIIDLTRTAFTTLAPLSKGRLAGSFITLGVLPSEVTKEYLSTDFFAPLGIILTANTPNLYALGETLSITGKTTNGLSESLIYIVEPNGNIISYGQSGSAIEYQVPLTQVGEYELVVAAGRSFSGAKSLKIQVLDSSITRNRQFFAAAPQTKVTLSTERREASDLTPSFLLRTPGAPVNTEKKLTIKTANQEYSAYGMGALALSQEWLAKFTS